MPQYPACSPESGETRRDRQGGEAVRCAYVWLPVEKPITFVFAAAPAVGLLGRDAVFLRAAVLAFVEKREVVQNREGLLGASKQLSK